MKHIKRKRTLLGCFVAIVIILGTWNIGRYFGYQALKAKSTERFFNDFMLNLSSLHDSLQPPIVENGEINRYAEKSVKLSLNNLLVISNMRYEWCEDIFFDDNNTRTHAASLQENEILEFFYDLNAFFNEHSAETSSSYMAWYNEDGLISNEETEYLHEKIEIVNRMYENCYEIYNNSHNTVKDIRNALFDALD